MSMKKIKRKQVAIIGGGLFMVGFLLILLGALLKQFWLVTIALLVLLAEIIFLVVFNRCPHCWHFLGHAGGGTFCPYCGKKLEE